MNTLMIGRIEIENKQDKALLYAKVTVGDDSKVVLYRVDSQYASFLTNERSDAFVVQWL